MKKSRGFVSSLGVLGVVSGVVTALITLCPFPRTGLAAPPDSAPPAPSSGGGEKKVQMLFVQTAKSATLKDGKLTLQGISPNTVFFSDRPERVAGHLATSEMIPLWGEGKDSFTKDPPNATLSTFGGDGNVMNVVMELRSPVLDGDKMSYDVKVLQGKMPSKAEAASLFIDVIGMPLTPVSYAGAARRARRRTVVVVH